MPYTPLLDAAAEPPLPTPDAMRRWRRPLEAGVLLAIAAALQVVARHNYLLFHALVELLSIVVALSVFVVAWTARRYLETPYLLVVGVAYLFVGFLDLVHTLAFPGMAVFAGATHEASQLWIAGRALQAVTLLGAFAFLGVRRPPNRIALLTAYGAATALLLACVFRWRIFPACFVEGVGQTPFKIASEYAIVALLGASLVLLWAERARFDPRVARAIGASILFAMAAEVAFSLYVTPSGLSNQIGHFLKLFSYVALYAALVESSVEDPLAIVFREVNAANARLTAEIAAHRLTALEKDAAIDELRAAVNEIRTLRGILPICSHCKKIRDDQGAWSQLEAYIQARSAAQFSHGICPDCARRHYPGLDLDAETPPGTTTRPSPQ